MPGQMRVRFAQCNGGKTPAKSVLAWLEHGLDISPEQHKAPRKPYAVAAYQHESNVEATITLATPDLLATAITYAQTGRHAMNGEWVDVAVEEAVFVPVAQILETASPSNRVKVRTKSPIINVSYGLDEPVVTKERLFAAILDRWKATESESAPSVDPLRDVETLEHQGHTVPYRTFGQHRGWVGSMFLKLHGSPEHVCGINALLTYGSAWGIGKGTTVGAGRFEVSCA